MKLPAHCHVELVDRAVCTLKHVRFVMIELVAKESLVLACRLFCVIRDRLELYPGRIAMRDWHAWRAIVNSFDRYVDLHEVLLGVAVVVPLKWVDLLLLRDLFLLVFPRRSQFSAVFMVVRSEVLV